MYKALLIDDDTSLIEPLADDLKPCGFDVKQETDPNKACEAIDTHNPDIVLLDLHFPGDDEHDAGQTTGVRLNAEIRNKYPNLAVLVFTSHQELLDIPRERFSGVEPHAQRVKPDFTKETWADELAEAMNTAIELASPFDADKDSERLGFIIGKTEQMQLVVKRITTYAQQTKNVMIYGEQGAGKSLVAQAIHKSSVRSEKKFLEFDCRANGKDCTKLEKALQKVDDGTLYLSDIHLLESELQEHLNETELNARLIAGTHKSLNEMTDDGFHNDLADDLTACAVSLPSLKERLDDDKDYLGKLFCHFVKKASEQVDGNNLYDDVVEKICGYDWPKNVREFKRVITQAVNTAVAGGNNVLRAQDLDLPGSVNLDTGNEQNFLEAQYGKFIACENPNDKYQFLIGMRSRTEQDKKERADLLIRFICCELRAQEGVAVSHQILFDAIHGYGDMRTMEETERAHNRVRAFVNNILAPREVNLRDLNTEGCNQALNSTN